MDIQRIFPRKDAKQRPADAIAAAEDAGQLALQAAKAIDDAVGSGWYTEHGNKADRAAFVLCRLRRARGGQWKVTVPPMTNGFDCPATRIA